MRRTDIPSELSELAFEFFYWFSRFEFALKECGYLKTRIAGSNAEPGWAKFVEQWQKQYESSDEARRLLAKPPMRQVVGPGVQLQWKMVVLSEDLSELDRVSRLLRVARNNLFHGGKHGSEQWDSPERTESLLRDGRAILNQLANMSDLGPDYERFY
ncbi:hypothetical protein [Paraburkholderia graminis]|uniref:hypothetical protein n=1 Tax=Paraburkholderia graminis TaxID=60548 RepID=UPI0005C69056|nr:hypothetical protein [Paraburkholderia graminis]